MNEEDFRDYFHLRWKMLRAPWGQKLDSEKDDLEDQSIHKMIVDNGKTIAVGRLHKSNQFVAQIRYMAVEDGHRGKGLGVGIIKALEHDALLQGVREIQLNAREDAVNFYKKLGYVDQGFSHVLFDDIKHFKMNKRLSSEHVRITENRLQNIIELQKIWHQTIPLSKAMNIEVAFADHHNLSLSCDEDFNKNLHNTMFAGSIYTLATLTGWGWLHLQMKAEGVKGDIVLADGSIRYLAPVKGSAIASTKAELASGKLTVLNKRKKAKFTIEVNVYSGDKCCASFKGIYVVLPT